MNALKLIVGLGNPGKKYQKHRHNLGFRVIDFLKKEWGPPAGVILEKPATFMNESGRAVSKLKKFYKLKNNQILVIHDEIDLPLGKIRFSADSGSAGHKGVASIMERIGRGFPRLRIGIDQRGSRHMPPTDVYVLQNFTAAEERKLRHTILPETLTEIKKWLEGQEKGSSS